MNGRNTTVISIRLPDSVYTTIKEKCGKQSVADFIKDLAICSVNTHTPHSVNATNPPSASVNATGIVDSFCSDCALSRDYGDHGRLTCSLTREGLQLKNPACDKWQHK